jgi:hypothetical protein
MVRLLLIGLVAVGLIGCSAYLDNTTRVNLDKDEGVYNYTDTITPISNDAYGVLLEWISMTYKSAQRVIDVQDKSMGLIVLKPITDISVYGSVQTCSYITRIKIIGNVISTVYVVGTLDNGAYPPKTSMPKLEAEFKILHSSMVRYIK